MKVTFDKMHSKLDDYAASQEIQHAEDVANFDVETILGILSSQDNKQKQTTKDVSKLKTAVKKMATTKTSETSTKA